MPDEDRWTGFVDMAKRSPGQNKVTVVTPAGDVELSFTCALRPDHLAKASQLLADPGLSIEYVADHVESLAAGLQL